MCCTIFQKQGHQAGMQLECANSILLRLICTHKTGLNRILSSSWRMRRGEELTYSVTSFTSGDILNFRNTFIENRSVCPLVGIGSPHPPLPQTSVSPRNQWGGGHTRLRVMGWGSPNSDYWRKSLALCVLCYQKRPATLNVSPDRKPA